MRVLQGSVALARGCSLNPQLFDQSMGDNGQLSRVVMPVGNRENRSVGQDRVPSLKTMRNSTNGLQRQRLC